MPLQLVEQVARAFALVDSGAGAGVNHRRIGGVHDDREHIGVVDHALVDAMPVGAAVVRLPGQVPGAGINHVGILGIDGDRFDVLEFGLAGRRNLLPAIAAVLALENAIQRARYQDVGIAGKDGHGAHRFSMHARQGFPVVAAIMRAIHVAGLLILDAPGGNINVFGILRIDDDVIENIVIAAQMGQPRPIVSAIIGEEKTAGAGTQVNTVGILRVEIQTPDITSVRTQGGPLTGPEGGNGEHGNS